MKIQHKFAIYMFLTVVLFLFAYSLLFYWYNRQSAITASLESMRLNVHDESHYLADRLIEKSKIALSMAASSILLQAVATSNNEYAALGDEIRKLRIDELNERWRSISDINDAFVKSYMHNELATNLKLQKLALENDIGEIFVTNRYGLAIATTNKLSTLSHAYKYWWQAAYHNGQGRIFFDDRGYDESVGGYVIGVVVPLMVNGQLAGILKCNFNLLPTLSDYLDSLGMHNDHPEQGVHKATLARSNGQVILGNETVPLSGKLPDYIFNQLDSENSIALRSNIHDEEHIVAAAPIDLTFNAKKYGFGGRYIKQGKLITHDQMGWYLVITEDVDDLLSPTLVYIEWIFNIGLVCALLAGAMALLMGRRIAWPITVMTHHASRIGQGQMDEMLQVDSTDELGQLAKSFNKMSSDLRASQVELLRKERLATLGQLIATVSHEIRNPLGAIQPALFVLQKKIDKNDQKMKNALTIAERNVERIDHIIDELLDFTRITELNKKPVAIDAWLESVMDAQRVEDKVPVVKDLSLHGLELQVDTGRLVRAIINVIDNACHAMQDVNFMYDDSALLTIKTLKTDNRVEIIISDTGCGMSDEILENVFKPLYSTKGFGVGLGMPVVKQIMEQHGGDIEISTQENEGTTITLWLPLDK